MLILCEFSDQLAERYALDPTHFYILLTAPYTSTVQKRSMANMRLLADRAAKNGWGAFLFTAARVKQRAVKGKHNEIVNTFCLPKSLRGWNKSFDIEIRAAIERTAFIEPKDGEKSALVAEVLNFDMAYVNETLQGLTKEQKDMIKNNQVELNILFSITDPFDIKNDSRDTLWDHVVLLGATFGYAPKNLDDEEWLQLPTTRADGFVQVAGGVYHKIGRVYDNSESVVQCLADHCGDLPHFRRLADVWARDKKLTESN